MVGKETPQYTPEQINELRASRVLHDAEAIKGGATYVDDEGVDDKGNSYKAEGRLEFTRSQNAGASIENMVKSAHLPKEMEKEIFASVSGFLRRTINSLKIVGYKFPKEL